MYKNYKEYKTMFFLILVTLGSSLSLWAMDSEQKPFAELMLAAHQNNTERVQELLLGHTTLAKEGTETQWGADPLAWAAHHGNAQMAELLLQSGFKLAMNLKNGSSPLHTAAYHDRVAVLRCLVTFPHCLQDSDLPKIKESQEESEVVRILTRRHFAFIRNLLDSKTAIVAVQMTPYEAASELPDTTCRELLEPEGLYARLSAGVMENYEAGLKKLSASGK